MARFEESFNEQLQQVIESYGFRISPRLPTVDRLAKFIQLSCKEQGYHMDDEEAAAAASLVYMQYTTNEVPTFAVVDNTVETIDHEDDNESIVESDDENDSDYEEPSSSYSKSKKSSNSMQVVLNTRTMKRVVQGSLGRSGKGSPNSHPMVRRSQV